MSSKIVINIHTNSGDEAIVSKQLGMSDSVPEPPSSDGNDMHEAAGGAMSMGAGQAASQAGAPAPPRDDDAADVRSPDNDKPDAGPPELSEDIRSSESDMSQHGDAPTPPANHPDIAGDDSVTSGSSGPPMPPSDDNSEGEDDDSGKKKSSKGSGGKKKKK